MLRLDYSCTYMMYNKNYISKNKENIKPLVSTEINLLRPKTRNKMSYT